jgi:hypothetical protein
VAQCAKVIFFGARGMYEASSSSSDIRPERSAIASARPVNVLVIEPIWKIASPLTAYRSRPRNAPIATVSYWSRSFAA